jgi:hypothetical protein
MSAHLNHPYALESLRMLMIQACGLIRLPGRAVKRPGTHPRNFFPPTTEH